MQIPMRSLYPRIRRWVAYCRCQRRDSVEPDRKFIWQGRWGEGKDCGTMHVECTQYGRFHGIGIMNQLSFLVGCIRSVGLHPLSSSRHMILPYGFLCNHMQSYSMFSHIKSVKFWMYEEAVRVGYYLLICFFNDCRASDPKDWASECCQRRGVEG